MRFLVGWAIVCCLGIATARADEDQVAVSKLYERGMAHYRLEEYPAAIEKWLEAFRIKPVPEFLYNIAQAYRASKQSERAVSYYQKYLSMRPNAQNRAEVMKQIAALNRQIAIDKAQPVPSTPTPPEPAVATSSVETPKVTPPPSATQEPAIAANSTTAVIERPSAPPKRITQKGWFWGVIAGSIVVVGVGIGVGVALGTRSSEIKTLPALTY